MGQPLDLPGILCFDGLAQLRRPRSELVEEPIDELDDQLRVPVFDDKTHCAKPGGCGYLEGHCTSSSQCQTGLVCAAGIADNYGFEDDSFNVCVPDDEALGGVDFCGSANEDQCGYGQGHCEDDFECAETLRCGYGNGAEFGFSPATNVCTNP